VLESHSNAGERNTELTNPNTLPQPKEASVVMTMIQTAPRAFQITRPTDGEAASSVASSSSSVAGATADSVIIKKSKNLAEHVLNRGGMSGEKTDDAGTVRKMSRHDSRGVSFSRACNYQTSYKTNNKTNNKSEMYPAVE
jgi:hypothetical protein